MKMVSRRTWVACVGWFGFSFTRAGDSWPDAWKKSVVKAAPQTLFLISAILREGVEGFAIQLVHSIQSAGSADEATGTFTRRVLEQFPGYSLAKTLITEISLPSEACSKDKQDQQALVATASYAVSAVMRRGATGFDILLLNGWVPANKADDALNSFLQSGGARFPNYAPIKTLVSELDIERPVCLPSSPMHGRWRQA